jgi:hypothetical protein
MSVPDVWRFPTGLPVVLALFSAFFWLLRPLKWRSRQQGAPYLLVFDPDMDSHLPRFS